MPRSWLFKSEPYEFSIDDLQSSPNGTAGWEGVRNYQARNLLRDEIQKDDLVVFYHSSVRPPAAVGLAKVVREGYPDRSDGTTDDDPVRWVQVDVQYLEHFPTPVTLDAMRTMPELEELPLLRRGNRLSIQPVGEGEVRALITAGGLDPAKFF